MSSATAIYGIVVRDWIRTVRQRGRLAGGLARSFMWLLLVGAGFNAIARVEGVSSYQTFIYPGVVVMATVFGAMLTAVATVYDREFGMLRLMMASPSGIPAVLAGRAIAATFNGLLQGTAVLIAAPLFVSIAPSQWLLAIATVLMTALTSSTLGLLVAAPLRSVENFAGIINIVLFPLIFLSGALYPSSGMPPVLRVLAQLNPVTYAVDLLRRVFAQGGEFSAGRSMAVLAITAVVAFTLTALIFDPEQRLVRRAAPGLKMPAGDRT
jgi:ABC-2 type transport system permease protein